MFELGCTQTFSPLHYTYKDSEIRENKRLGRTERQPVCLEQRKPYNSNQ